MNQETRARWTRGTALRREASASPGACPLAASSIRSVDPSVRRDRDRRLARGSAGSAGRNCRVGRFCHPAAAKKRRQNIQSRALRAVWLTRARRILWARSIPLRPRAYHVRPSLVFRARPRRRCLLDRASRKANGRKSASSDSDAPRARTVVVRASRRGDAELDHHDLYALLRGISRRARGRDSSLLPRADERCHPDVAASARTPIRCLTGTVPVTLGRPSPLSTRTPGSDPPPPPRSTTAPCAGATPRRRPSFSTAPGASCATRAARAAYDSGRALFGSRSSSGSRPFDGEPLSKNARPDLPFALFVDEGLFVGTRGCARAAPNTFRDARRVQRRSRGRPVGRIPGKTSTSPSRAALKIASTVPKADLPLLEWIHASQPRQRVTCALWRAHERAREGTGGEPVRRRLTVRTKASGDVARRSRRRRPSTRGGARRRLSRASQQRRGLVAMVRRKKNQARGRSAEATTEGAAPSCPLPEVFVNRALLALPGVPRRTRREGGRGGVNSAKRTERRNLRHVFTSHTHSRENGAKRASGNDAAPELRGGGALVKVIGRRSCAARAHTPRRGVAFARYQLGDARAIV